MVLINKITDDDLNEKSVEMTNPRIRYAARGIVIRDDGKIAVFHKTKKNEYKLPGGGIEENENPKDTFKREILEETGCTIEIIDELETIEEYRSQDNFKQISFVFVGKVKEDTETLHLTPKEQDEGAILTWEYPFKALELITNSYDNLIASKYQSVYHTRFTVFRDRKILEFYLNKVKISTEFVNNWLRKLKEYWFNKDIENSVSLFTKTKFYQETPFMNPYTTIEEIKNEWQHVKNEDIKKIEFKILAIDGYKTIVEWYLDKIKIYMMEFMKYILIIKWNVYILKVGKCDNDWLITIQEY